MTGIIKKKVLFVAPYFKPHTGGLENYVANIGKGLRNFGWETVVVSSNNIGEPYQEEIVDDVKVYRLPTLIKISNTPLGLFWYNNLRDIIAHEKPDIINAHMPVSGIADFVACAAGKIPLVVTYHMGSMKKNKWTTDVFIKFYERTLLKKVLGTAQSIICSSVFVQTNFLKSYFHKTSVITPGVDVDFFHPTKKQYKYNLMHVGGLRKGEAHKGLAESIKIVAKLKEKYPEIHLNIVGSGNNADYYKDLANRMGISKHVTFCGALSPSEIVKIYQKTNIFLAPVKKESFGISIIEAMACGLPVIANNIEGVPYLVQDNVNGFVTEIGEIDQIVEKVDFLFQRPNVAKILGEAGRKLVVSKYQWKDKVVETNTHLLEILEADKTKPKVLIAAPYYFPKVGGLENYAHQIALQLIKSGWEVVVVSSNNYNRKFQIETIDGVRIYRLPVSFHISNTPIGLRWIFFVPRIIKKEKPDVINAHTPVPGISDIVAISKGRIPFILTYHAATLYKNNNIIFNIVIFLYRFVERVTLYLAKNIISVTPYHKDYISAGTKNKIKIIENGISCNEITSGIVKKNPYRIVFIGNLEKAHAWKGLEEVLNAVKIYMDRYNRTIYLDVIGGGNNMEYYKDRSENLGLSKIVYFHGQKTGNEKNRILERATALICYPTSAQDAFPTVILEAWAHSTPVIAADIGALTYIVHDKRDGILVEPQNPRILAEKFYNFIQDVELQQILAQAGHERASYYTWDQQGAKTDKLFRNIL